jgi:ribosomal protein L11 methyltransferase
MAEIITAFLGGMGFDTFEMTENGVDAYISDRNLTEEVRANVLDLQSKFGFTFDVEEIQPQNWNAEWEANFKPVIVEGFCAVRASFHEPIENVKFELVINPKMAFGTGHHETTYMVMDMMQKLDFENKTVFDYGCGTGILAILAAKLKAKYIDAVDIENESYLNTIENSEINEVNNINTIEGTLENITGDNYDIILANINRHVILNSLKTLRQKLTKNGAIIFSGILVEDETLVRKALENHQFNIQKVVSRNNWICILAD